MQITSISKFRQALPKINQDLQPNDFVVVVSNSQPEGVFVKWERWQEIQKIIDENADYSLLLKNSKSYGNLEGEKDGDEELYSISDTKPLTV